MIENKQGQKELQDDLIEQLWQTSWQGLVYLHVI
jgi:hypothetical protein